MDPVRCANQVFVDGGPSLLCSCPAGLIHMHDCPVSMGLPCVHFQEQEEGAALPLLEFESLHDRLMADYLSRAYTHRVRSLSPAGDPWAVRRAEIAATYDPDEEESLDAAALEEYERERDELIARRKRREEERAAASERTREQKALERARMGIKTVVEKAQEAVAAQGNVASSIVDEVKLPKGPPRKRRGRGRGKPDNAAPDGQAPRKRRRRRRRKPKGGGPAA